MKQDKAFIMTESIIAYFSKVRSSAANFFFGNCTHGTKNQHEGSCIQLGQGHVDGNEFPVEALLVEQELQNLKLSTGRKLTC